MSLFTMELDGFLGAAAMACGAMILIGLGCSVVRLVRGPTTADRVVALDLVSMLVVAFLTLFAMAVRRDAFLDAALALALVAFLATVAFARFIERARQRGQDEP